MRYACVHAVGGRGGWRYRWRPTTRDTHQATTQSLHPGVYLHTEVPGEDVHPSLRVIGFRNITTVAMRDDDALID